MEAMAWVQQHEEAMERQRTGAVAPSADKVLVRLRDADGNLVGQLVMDWREASEMPVKAQVEVNVRLVPSEQITGPHGVPLRVGRRPIAAGHDSTPDATAKG